MSPPIPARSLRTQIALVFGSFAATLAILLCLLGGEVLKLRMQKQAATALHIVASNAATLLQQDLQQQIRRAQVLASSKELWQQGLRAPSVSDTLARVQQINPHNMWLGIADAQGIVQSATGHLLEGQDVSQRSWFQQGQKGPFISDVHPAKLLAEFLPLSPSGEPMRLIDFSAPILHPQGQLLGVVGIHASWDWVRDALERLLQGAAQDSEQSLFIFEHSGGLIYAPDGSATATPAQALPTAFRTHPPQPQVLAWKDREQPFLTAAVRLPTPTATQELGWWVVARQPVETAYADANRVLVLAVALALLCGLLAAVVAWQLASHVSNDLKQLVQAARRIHSTAPEPCIPVLYSNRDVYALSSALSSMTQQLLKANETMQQEVHKRTEELESANAELHRQASTDPLTQVLNRRGFETQAYLALALARRSGRPMSLLSIDIDFFKRVNDQYGHDVGDLVLARLAAVLRERTRESDVVARFGGEEFLVLLPDTDGPTALRLAEQLLQTIAAAPMPQVGHITVSAGVSSLRSTEPESDDLFRLIKRSDEALYEAKHTGRNRACRVV